MNKTINIEDIFIKTGKSDKRFTVFLKQSAQQLYKDSKISKEDFSNLIKGGSADEKEIIEAYSDKKYVYPNPIFCMSCKNKKLENKTHNLPGIICYITKTPKLNTLNIKVNCKNCSSKKNSYIKRDTLPQNILSHIKKVEDKNN